MEIFLLVILVVVVLAWFAIKHSFKSTDFVETNEVPYKVEPPVQPQVSAPVVESAPVVTVAKKARKPRVAKASSTKTKKTAAAKSKKTRI